jgi:heme/copper-type cytochrome/quinol oxidase subunit 2
MDLIAASEAFKVTFVSILIWIVLFPVLVQGLIIYAVVLARGEKRENEEYRRQRQL